MDNLETQVTLGARNRSNTNKTKKHDTETKKMNTDPTEG